MDGSPLGKNDHILAEQSVEFLSNNSMTTRQDAAAAKQLDCFPFICRHKSLGVYVTWPAEVMLDHANLVIVHYNVKSGKKMTKKKVRRRQIYSILHSLGMDLAR